MLTMSQINHIKDLSNCGYRISEISKKTGTDPKTIRKYLAQDDFPPQPPIIQEKPSKLEIFNAALAEANNGPSVEAVSAKRAKAKEEKEAKAAAELAAEEAAKAAEEESAE